LTTNSKCSFVTVIGEPNAGKSTLINKIVGEKISIVSNKVQTTRRPVRGIVNLGMTQIVFVDTPGFCRAGTPLEKVIFSNFKASYKSADMTLLVIDAASKTNRQALSFIENQKRDESKFSVVINKIDAVKKATLLPLADKMMKYDFVGQVFMISALNGDGIEELKIFLRDSAPDGHWLYEQNQSTDLSLKIKLSEITREKLFNKLDKELPYSLYVETELLREFDTKTEVCQAIVVIKNSQKGIILGKNGRMIKGIREEATFEMKKLLHKKIELKLFVKVREKWPEKKEHLQNAGIID
jgi:GTP-binding protein Era